MGLTHFKGHYCLKCETPRGEAIGGAPRCEQCGDDLKYVEVGHTPARFAGYIFLVILIFSVISVIVMTLIMNVVGLILLVMVCIGAGFLALVCLVVNNAMMKKKIASKVPKPLY